MRNIEYFRDKRVTIVGLAKSGASCAELLSSLGAMVSVTEQKDNEEVRCHAAGLKAKKIRLELGGHTPEFIRGQDLVVISPGVAGHALPVVWAEELKVPVISEIEVGWFLCPGTVIAVTGSSGKTTVTTLISRIFEAAGRKTFLLGNIGDPFCGQVEKVSARDYVCLEVSSFQLERIRDFKPQVAVILNIGRNHLDRHKDMEEYIAAKKRIFMNQDKADFLVYNHDDEVLRLAVAGAEAGLVPFSAAGGLNPNEEALIGVGKVLGIDKKLIHEAFKNFTGLPHRMECVADLNGIRFINDSKATTAESTIWALNNIKAPVILIAGGKDKGVDYGLIKQAAAGKVKLAVLIGEAASIISSALGDLLKVEYALDLSDAVNKAHAAASAGDCVLLSPMCSSFDMFSGYEERGECFKKAVASL
ncbi:MAG: Mur ligase family protein [Candidatus Omnitrophota bacterium]|nr:Mur ligase family protein [Candidatus Omnitrophota bacterium]